MILALFLLAAMVGPSAAFGVVPPSSSSSSSSPAPPSPPRAPSGAGAAAGVDRRSSIQTGLASAAGLLLLPAALVSTTAAAPAAAGHQIDYSAFKKSLFNTPPGLLQFPPWMEGEWDAAFSFVGADFPSSASSSSSSQASVIPKDRIVADTSLPGFRRLSIAMVPDVGKPHSFRMRFRAREDEGARRVEEDRAFNLKNALESEVGKGAVASVDYNPDRNPNRLTINLLPQAAVNAQKIELFCNARAPLPAGKGEEGAAEESFRFVEDIRQVSITSRLAETTTVGDYRHVWELYRQGDGSVKGFLSTVSYATPQDALFQLGAFAPLVVYFHTVRLMRSTEMARAEGTRAKGV
jgi:hypothetical protein